MFRDVPIVKHFAPDPTATQLNAIETLSAEIRRERPELAADLQFRSLMPSSLADGACLHLDDLSEITHLDYGSEFQFLQERARLRAGDGDLVVSNSSEVAGYEEYCQNHLGLGAPEWLRATPGRDSLRIAHACWQDRQVRSKLVHRLRTDALHYLHPLMGTFGVWELGKLLHEHSRRPVMVIAPPPALSKFVNDKVSFARIVSQLLGDAYVPETVSAWNMAMLCQHVAELAATAHTIGLKRPLSAGGDAIAILSMKALRGRSLHELHDMLEEPVSRLQWDCDSELLIGTWEADVRCSPSAQLWIPPTADGPPIMEGIFTQILDHDATVFRGAVEADLPDNITREFVTNSWLLGRLFQELGYVGRCSFDAILIGESLPASRLEFVECNGRWGGTSLPMSLMNRIFGDWRTKPYATGLLRIEGISDIGFPRLWQTLAPLLYDHRTGDGRLIVMAPGRVNYQSAISVVALGESSQDADVYLEQTAPKLLKQAIEAKI